MSEVGVSARSPGSTASAGWLFVMSDDGHSSRFPLTWLRLHLLELLGKDVLLGVLTTSVVGSKEQEPRRSSRIVWVFCLCLDNSGQGLLTSPWSLLSRQRLANPLASGAQAQQAPHAYQDPYC